MKSAPSRHSWVYKRLAGQGIIPVWKDEPEEEAAKD